MSILRLHISIIAKAKPCSTTYHARQLRDKPLCRKPPVYENHLVSLSDSLNSKSTEVWN
jgi:hypothetical protein